jgi:hypothetical protein
VRDGDVLIDGHEQVAVAEGVPRDRWRIAVEARVFLVPRNWKAVGSTVGAPAPCPLQLVIAAAVSVPAAMIGHDICVPRMFPFASVRFVTSRMNVALRPAQ